MVVPAPSSLARELTRRKHFLGPSFSTHYTNPLVLSYGRGTFLFDIRGQAFLDCVNNPASLGHCHPAVVEAASEQLGVLNTNTRYVYPQLADYAQALTATLPSKLHVCFFVNSGSEANDLALRMAKQHTKQQDVLCVDGGYHGHTATLVNISPYKFKGKGGFPCPDTTQVLPCPDLYRGQYASHPDPAAAYAKSVEEGVQQIVAKGRKPAAFFCEGVLSTAGYIPLPDGYLEAAYKAVRAEGGLCISDEVQSGFGRAGEGKMWGFQLAAAEPDIVTMGKPMGNGFPLAAVVTTPEIAASFANGMEYFNTFGGGPVAMRVGSAVLHSMAQDRLLENVLLVSRRLLSGLQRLCRKHPLAGDARGSGLFLGLELVRDAQKTPATEETSYLVEAARLKGVLLGADGPGNNVLKIKPPLCISEAHVDLLLTTLDEILSSMPSLPPHQLKEAAEAMEEDLVALRRVQTVVRKHGVGAGKTWQAEVGRTGPPQPKRTRTWDSWVAPPPPTRCPVLR